MAPTHDPTHDRLPPGNSTHGPPVATKYVHDMTRFDRIMERLQEWRSADHEDHIALSRHQIIEIVEGVKALRTPEAQAALDKARIGAVTAEKRGRSLQFSSRRDVGA